MKWKEEYEKKYIQVYYYGERMNVGERENKTRNIEKKKQA